MTQVTDPFLARVVQTCKKDDVQPSRYVDFGCPILNEATLGLDEGVFIVAGPPNFGKSAWVLNIYNQVLLNNMNVDVLDFSLDDSFDNRVRNSIARIAQTPINWVKLP